MEQKEPSKRSKQELHTEAKKTKRTSIINALLIGFLVGIILFSIFNKTVGLFTLIPLYFIYRFVNRDKEAEA